MSKELDSALTTLEHLMFKLKEVCQQLIKLYEDDSCVHEIVKFSCERDKKFAETWQTVVDGAFMVLPKKTGEG